jgi:hypothetical protein
MHDLDTFELAQTAGIFYRSQHGPHVITAFQQHIDKVSAQKTGGTRY